MREAFWLLVLLTLSACSTPAGYYATNRLDDLTDVAHADLHGARSGVLANVGPAMYGWEMASARTLQVGLGGVNEIENEWEVAIGGIYPFSWHKQEKRSIYRSVARPTRYGRRAPAWGSLGLNVGFAYGVGARVDVVELADFILGLFAVDILGDDVAPEQSEDAAPMVSGG